MILCTGYNVNKQQEDSVESSCLIYSSFLISMGFASRLSS